MLLFYEGYIVLVSHPNTNPAEQGLTSVNFGITKLSDAQRACLNLWWKEVYQHVSPEANVSHFPFIFFNLSGFSTLLVTTCLLRLFTQDFYHGTTMIDNTKTISCTTIELHITQGQICFVVWMCEDLWAKGPLLVWLLNDLEKNCLERCTYHRQPSVPSRRV